MTQRLQDLLPLSTMTFNTNHQTNILFYLEPIIFNCKPFLYTAWVSLWAMLVETLDQNSKYKFSYKLITSEPLASIVSQYNLPTNVDVIPISQEKILEPFNFLAMDAGIAWYKETYTAEQMNATAQMFTKEINGWQPEIIISSSQIPFLKEIFPQAIVFYFEVGMTSRPPFPRSYYLDPLGLYEHSTLAKKCDEIKQLSIGSENIALLEKYRDFYVSLIRAKNPLSEFINSYQGKFRFIILLPLQVEGCWGNGNCDFITNFQFVHMVLSKIDPEIGVLVTLHPSDQWMTKDIEEYFKNKFPNFIYSSDILNFDAASQYLIDSIDAVLAVSTMVGLQSLIWKKKLYAIGETQLKVAAEYCFKPDLSDLNKLPSLLKMPTIDMDNVLFWLLTRFYIPKSYFYDPKWLANYLIRMSGDQRTANNSLDVYHLIDDPSTIFSHLMDEVCPDIPVKQETLPIKAGNVSFDMEEELQKSNKTVLEIKKSFAWRSIIRRDYSELITFMNGNNRLLLIHGWSASEPWGVWSNSKISDILISLPENPGKDIVLQCEVSAFVSDKHPIQIIDVLVNSEKVGTWIFEIGKENPDLRKVIVPLRIFERSPLATHLHFEFHSAISPASLGLSTDDRVLALGLISLQFDNTRA